MSWKKTKQFSLFVQQSQTLQIVETRDCFSMAPQKNELDRPKTRLKKADWQFLPQFPFLLLIQSHSASNGHFVSQITQGSWSLVDWLVLLIRTGDGYLPAPNGKSGRKFAMLYDSLHISVIYSITNIYYWPIYFVCILLPSVILLVNE